MNQDLQQRIRSLEGSFDQLSEQFRMAFHYSSKDPQASLNKVRIILEKIVRKIYAHEVGEEREDLMLGAALRDPRMKQAIERRILSKMHSIRSMSNLAVHGERVTANDAMKSIDNLCDVMDWYIGKYDTEEKKKGITLKKYLRPMIIAMIVLGIGVLGFVFYPFESTTEAQASQVDEGDALQFVKDFETSINGDDLDHIISFYADQVNYYGNLRPLSEIWMDKRAFLNRWKDRYYFVSSPISILNTDGNIYEMEYEVSFNAMDSFRDAKASGIWKVQLIISVKEDGGFEVIKVLGNRQSI
jgi:hypothetical protein